LGGLFEEVPEIDDIVVVECGVVLPAVDVDKYADRRLFQRRIKAFHDEAQLLRRLVRLRIVTDLGSLGIGPALVVELDEVQVVFRSRLGDGLAAGPGHQGRAFGVTGNGGHGRIFPERFVRRAGRKGQCE
jgi:hypothetical protein